MKCICFVCNKEIDTEKDEYICIGNPDGTMMNDEKTPRKHFDCRGDSATINSSTL